MCGIAGFCGSDITDINLHKCLDNMLRVIIHRGPDGSGIYNDKQVHMGMRRLSIIDLSTGNQPIFNEARTVVVVCNGEIYNYIELRKELEQKGHHFKTNSDIEVIVHLYEDFGIDFLSHLNGMFALSLWDATNRKLVLARDRMGEKPLYYYHQANTLVYGSEIKSILQWPYYAREVNLQALNELLTYNYVPYPNTMFKNIYRIPPGCYLTFHEGTINIQSYWDIPYGNVNMRNESVYCTEIIDLLKESLRIRLRSDVPIGAFLSGGVDSSAIVALTAAISTDKLKTFSIGFEEKKYNELPYANLIASQFQTEHYTEIVKNNIVQMLPRSIWYTENPHGDFSFLPTYEVSNLASRHVKVALTGDGSDELFAGYDKYSSFFQKYQHSGTIEDYLDFTSVFSAELKQNICSSDIIKASDVKNPLHEISEKLKGEDFLSVLLYSDLKLLLEGNNLVKPDRMGMACSIEPRVPFLDHRLVEYISTIPSDLKLRGTTTKYILKKALEAILPHEILYTSKRMFTVPIGEWLKTELKQFMYEILTDKITQGRGYFNQECIKNMMDMHVSGKVNYTRELRLLIVIEVWHRMFIDKVYDKQPTIETLLNKDGCTRCI